MFPEGRYFKTKNEFNDYEGNDFETLYGGSFNKINGSDFIAWDESGNNDIWSISDGYDKSYSYDQAIELAGNGCYNIGLLAVLCLTLAAMATDMFSFSTVVVLSSCELQLTLGQTSILMSIPFTGAITMAYTWGYISDTQGRRSSLLAAMSVSFVMSLLCAFAPNWIALAVFKLIGTCFCSCAQSTTYTLLGESCGPRIRSTYLQVLSSTMYLPMAIYYPLAHSISYLDFSYDLGFIAFTPWRFLSLLLALPLGLSAFSLFFFYESPKFLLNAGLRDEALELLKNIRRRNGLDVDTYPVRNLVLKETGNIWCAEVSLLGSMWRLTTPLFRPPYIRKTLLLYFLVFIIYSSGSTVFVWLPYLGEALSSGVMSSKEQDGLCSILARNTTDTNAPVTCTSKLDLPIVLFTVPFGVIMFTLSFTLSKLAERKKVLMIAIYLATAASCVCAVLVPDNIADVVFYMAIGSVNICGGMVLSYCVDLYPTSFRGTATCLGVMVGRLSSVIGVNLIGPHFVTSCQTTFYSMAGMLCSGAVAACFLPQDKPKKKKNKATSTQEKEKVYQCEKL